MRTLAGSLLLAAAPPPTALLIRADLSATTLNRFHAGSRLLALCAAAPSCRRPRRPPRRPLARAPPGMPASDRQERGPGQLHGGTAILGTGPDQRPSGGLTQAHCTMGVNASKVTQHAEDCPDSVHDDTHARVRPCVTRLDRISPGLVAGCFLLPKMWGHVPMSRPVGTRCGGSRSSRLTIESLTGEGVSRKNPS